MHSDILTKLTAIISSHNGVLLSQTIPTTRSDIRLRCAHNHEWSAKASSILYNRSWCPICARNQRRFNLATIQTIAKRQGGLCLSNAYANVRSPMAWQCSEGHQFDATVAQVQKGQWCPCCTRTPSTMTYRGLQGAIAMATEHGGKHLGGATSVAQKTVWACGRGHRFQATGRSILLRNYFCKACEHQNVVTIDDIDAECRRRGGRCLSLAYANLSHKLNFECAEGHHWVSSWRSVNHAGSWCPTCAKKKTGNQALQNIATRHGGSVLSGEYKANDLDYVWRCNAGHVFIATLSHARKHWCDTCSTPRTSGQTTQAIDH